VGDGVAEDVGGDEHLRRRLTTREGGEGEVAGAGCGAALNGSSEAELGVCKAHLVVVKASSTIEAYVTLWSMS